MKTEELIAEAEQLDKEATKGPFAVQDPMGPDILSIVANPDVEPFDWIHVAQIGTEPVEDDTRSFSEHEANAQFFARSRTLLPELARRVKVALDAIRNAPHEPECHSRRSRVTPQGMQRGQCNCWLQSALDALEGGK